MKPSTYQRILGIRLGRGRLVPLVVAIASVCWTSEASAQYTANAYASSLIGSTNTPGDVTYSSGSPNDSVVVSFTSSPVASVSSTVYAFNPLGQAFTTGGGIMTYRFEVSSDPFTNVPIDFSGLFSSFQGAAGSLAATQFSIQTVNSSVSTYATFQSYLYGDCGAPTCLQFNNLNATNQYSQSDIKHVDGTFDGSFGMLTNADGKVIGSVQLAVSTTVNIGIVPASASAFLDPHLEIDAAFLAAHPGSLLTITPGVGNELSGAVTVVPEPSTYALMAAGLGALAWVGRRKRQSK